MTLEECAEKERRKMEDGVGVAKPSSDIVARGADDAILGENGDHRKYSAIAGMTPARLAVMNLYLSWATMFHLRHIGTMVQKGRKELVRVSEKAEENSSRIETLKTRVTSIAEVSRKQSRAVHELGTAVDKQKNEVEAALKSFQSKVGEQAKRISHHEKSIESLVASKIKKDMIVDVSTMFLSLWLSQTSIFAFPVQVFTNMLPLGRRRKGAVHYSLRIFVVLYVSMLLRRISVKSGVHSSLGTPKDYLAQFLQLLQSGNIIPS